MTSGGVGQPFMALSFLALPVIPKLKLTDQGLVDVELFGMCHCLCEKYARKARKARRRAEPFGELKLLRQPQESSKCKGKILFYCSFAR